MKPRRPKTFCIYPPLERQFSGPLTFAGHLKAYLEAQGYAHRAELDGGLGILIVFVQAPLGMLRRARALGIPVLLRLDGIYYPRKHGWFHREYFRINFKVWIIRKWLCDQIVYQSKFSKAMLDALLGSTSKPWCVIHNGIAGAPSVSIPAGGAAGPRAPGRPLRFAATGRFRGDDMLPPTVRALDLCAGRFPFTLDVYGSVDDDWKPWLERPYIKAMGKVPNEALRRALAVYDALLFTQTSPSCPNVIIEAMAAGVPVLAYATGAVAELLPFNRDLLAPTPDRLLHGAEDFDPAALARCLERFASTPEAYRAEAEAHRGDFSEARTLALYADALEALRR